MVRRSPEGAFGMARDSLPRLTPAAREMVLAEQALATRQDQVPEDYCPRCDLYGMHFPGCPNR